ncbi:tyrosine-type recombinase/integrase [Psychrobacillus sp. OK032]|uniref:tyrosine-type recombinase/integrase n=1 Tax=Psychrobacillus sp. OK032 TaxID=1884358 RepID=UPI0008C8471E|nr:tyrosine-type recombinase/integrase [Psychrobacillus sp. OK032]SES38421.1 Phage integrase family protein [Psychrobacillus sp. OK032]
MKHIVNYSKGPKIRFHEIRHTHASFLISEGVDIVKISKRLGHANPKITLEFYAHLLPNEDNDIATFFMMLFKIKTKKMAKVSIDLADKLRTNQKLEVYSCKCW